MPTARLEHLNVTVSDPLRDRRLAWPRLWLACALAGSGNDDRPDDPLRDR